MKRKMWFGFAAVFIFVLFFLYSSFFGNPITKYQMVGATKEYLVEKGYNETDIHSIKSDYHFKRNSDDMNGTVTYVVFKDEQTIQYTYVQWKSSKEIQQHCTSYDLNSNSYRWSRTEELKNFDKNCTPRDG
jgi:hypothetical protein